MKNTRFVVLVVIVIANSLFAQVPEMVRQSYPGSGRYSKGTFRNLTTVGNTLYFVTDDGIHGSELFKTDGTAAGTQIVIDLREGSKGVNPSNLIAFKNQLFFFGYEGSQNANYSGSLYKTDGTAAGTVKVKSVAHGSSFFNPDRTSLVIGDTMYFSGYDNVNDVNLWKTDGTEAGTVKVKNIHQLTYDQIENFTEMNGILYFIAKDDSHGLELWKSDGTNAGTVLIKDINPGGNDSSIGRMVVLNNELYFPANDGIHGLELWKSDGTEVGTVMVKDVNLGGDSDIENLCALNNSVFFAANDGTAGQELWKSDGTASGTVLLKDIREGFVGYSTDSNPNDLVAIGNTLYFLASDGVRGTELWKSNGTSSGTEMVADIYPNSANGVGAGNNSLVVFQNQLIFKGNDKVHGQEPWISDGTEAGTRMLKDIHPGKFYEGKLSIGHGRVTNNGIFYFLEYDGVNGTEPALWKLENPVLNVNNNHDTPSLNIYPNPAVNSFKITSTNVQIKEVKVFSIMGKLVKSYNENYIKNETLYDVSNLNSGVYVINIYTDKNVVSRKIVKH